MSRPVSIEPVPGGVQRDLALEGLRGLAALTVFYGHLMAVEAYHWSPSVAWTWPAIGPAAVLVFFVLSGYVIGLRYRAAPEPGAVREYLWRRALRVVPINLAGVLLACAVAESLDWPTVLVNLFFLENYCDYFGAWLPGLPANPNLWSLNYEVLFYLLFAVLWWRRVSFGLAAGVAAVLGVCGWFGWGVPVFIACYAFGFLFWLAGLGLARGSRPAETDSANWPSCLLLMLVTWKLQGFAELMLRFDLTPPRFAGPVVRLYYLDFLPACVWLLAAVARRTFPGIAIVRAIALLVPLPGFVLRLSGGLEEFPGETVVLVAVYLLALAAWRWRPSNAVFARISWLGTISFALYATGRPIQVGVYRVATRLPHTALVFALAATITTGLAFGVAWYLDGRLQPMLRDRFRTKKQDVPQV